MTTILITNDDGIHSPGLSALGAALHDLGRIITVAPDRDKSAVSHSLTMHQPLRVVHHGKDRISVDGTPTDCVAIGLQKILSAPPDLLVSGINRGANIGDDISYSGTVAAALEATMHSIPSMAVSCTTASCANGEGDYAQSAAIAARLAAQILQRGLPENTLLNVNIPAQEDIKGLRITRQGRSLWRDSIHETTDPWGKKIFWIGGGRAVTDSAADTDLYAISNGYVSITPIHLDKTNHEGIIHLKEDWHLEY